MTERKRPSWKIDWVLVVFLSLTLPLPGMIVGVGVGQYLGRHFGGEYGEYAEELWLIQGTIIGAFVGFLTPWLVAVVVSAFQAKERVHEQS